MKENDDNVEENNKIIEEVEEIEEIKVTKKTIEQGFSQFIDSNDLTYCLVDNIEKEKTKLFININL